MIVKTIAKVKPAFPFEAYSHVVSPIDPKNRSYPTPARTDGWDDKTV